MIMAQTNELAVVAFPSEYFSPAPPKICHAGLDTIDVNNLP